LGLRQRLLEEQVLPSAEQQHRNLRALQRLMQLQLGPVRVVVFRMLEPRLVPRRASAEQRPAGLADWQRAGRRFECPARPYLADERADAARIPLVGEHVGPAKEVVEPERTGTPARGAEIMRADADDRRL